jgi:nucleoside-diphosphate-sugar epimerase/quercetin dioxygenase-like cupin family protein
MKKIIITGGLGYIGTELCRLYSGVSWKHNIIVIDNRFLSQRVNELRNWNIDFIQGSILDKNFLNGFLKDADVVHHLAGITDVAYLKDDIDPIRDKKIYDVGVIGTQNVINAISKDCKLIFPSTHVVFEGLKEVRKDLIETDLTYTELTYSKGKVQNELDIIKKCKNYIILRLASVYGYSQDTTRLSIVPNLFSKITSQNGVIELHSNGTQLKSLVPLIDVARCFKFMEESQIRNEIFHLSKDSVTIKDIAYICKNLNPKVSVIDTNKSAPNPGYTISNKKLLDTGFKFLYGIEQSIKEMIQKWSSHNLSKELEYIRSGEKDFIDERGKISNYELNEPINLIGLIKSKKHSVRANHFHPVQEQKCLVIEGQFISVYKDLLDNQSVTQTHVVNAGDLVVTKPNVAHSMIFTEDTIFLNLVRGEREHENYGITHTIPHLLVNQEIKKNLIDNYKFECRCCGEKRLIRVISFGFMPLANNLLSKKNDSYETFPLELNYCSNCSNCQLSYVVNQEKLFSNYLYLSSVSDKFKEHFNQATQEYIEEFNLKKKDSFIIDVGCNDGIALIPFKERGYVNLLGIEPASNIAKICSDKGIKTLNNFFDRNIINKINQKADIILLSNVFAHSDKIDEITSVAIDLLNKKGVIIIEVQYLVNTLKDLSFDNIYHEHVNYWSLTSLNFFFKKHSLNIFNVKKINTHGGSIRVYLCNKDEFKVSNEVNKILEEEEKFGINNFSTYKNFAQSLYQIKNNVKKNLKNLLKENKKIYGYGAPAKASTAINFFQISQFIEKIIEDNPLKYSKYIPGTEIEIIKKEDIKNIKPEFIIVFAWNFFQEIKNNNKLLSNVFINIKDLER